MQRTRSIASGRGPSISLDPGPRFDLCCCCCCCSRLVCLESPSRSHLHGQKPVPQAHRLVPEGCVSHSQQAASAGPPAVWTLQAHPSASPSCRPRVRSHWGTCFQKEEEKQSQRKPRRRCPRKCAPWQPGTAPRAPRSAAAGPPPHLRPPRTRTQRAMPRRDA